MEQGKSRPMTHVANCYHEDIQACVRSNRMKVSGRGLAASSRVVHNTRHKRKYVMQDPGFATIKPGCYLGFAESGGDGHVFVTIKIGSDIPHTNFQVCNGRNVIVDKEGSLRNAKDNEIWTDTSGEIHLEETPANMNVISSAGGPIKNQDPLEGGPRTSERQPAEDSLTKVLLRYRNKGRVKTYFGTKGDDVGRMDRPFGICSTASDNIVVADTFNHRIQIFDVNGQVKGVFGSEGTLEGQFNGVIGVCVTAHGYIVASDWANHRIQIFDEQGKFVRKFGSKGSEAAARSKRLRGDGKLKCPLGVATDDKGLIYVCDVGNHRVQVFSPNGKFVRKFGSESLRNPRYLSVTSNDRVVVSDWGNHRVQVFDSHGRHLFQFGTEGTSQGQFKHPEGIATDQHGNIIVTDLYNHRVQVFTSNGEFVSCFGSAGSEPGQMKEPQGVCVLSDGGIAVSDWGNNRVQIF